MGKAMLDLVHIGGGRGGDRGSVYKRARVFCLLVLGQNKAKPNLPRIPRAPNPDRAEACCGELGFATSTTVTKFYNRRLLA